MSRPAAPSAAPQPLCEKGSLVLLTPEGEALFHPPAVPLDEAEALLRADPLW